MQEGFETGMLQFREPSITANFIFIIFKNQGLIFLENSLMINYFFRL